MRKTLIIMASLALSGCVTLPSMKQIKPDLPTAWLADSDPATRPDSVTSDWWQAYNDPILNQLITEALEHNRDLKLAAARIEEMRATLGLADADRYPSLQVGANAGRTRVTTKGTMPVTTPVNNNFKLNLQAAWEVDIWGRYREASNAARAELLATEYGRAAVNSSLISAVTQSYFALTALDASANLTQGTLANRKEAVTLHRVRFEAGVASELALRQAEADLASVEINLAQLARQIRQQELALALLLGREPRAIMQDSISRNANLDSIALPPAVPAGLPSDLLLRRPDLRQAEQNLFAAQARIREAGAAIYPNLSLTANLGTESKALSDLFSGPAGIWGLGVGLTQTLFNAGRTEAAIKAADARQDQALIAYEQAVQVAFKEVLDALVVHREARETRVAEAKQVIALKRAAELAGLRYQAGLTNLLEVLDAKRSLLQAEQGGIEAQRAQLAATADLFKALGGGWKQVLTPVETSQTSNR